MAKNREHPVSINTTIQNAKMHPNLRVKNGNIGEMIMNRN
jgi:hypothetical protein